MDKCAVWMAVPAHSRCSGATEGTHYDAQDSEGLPHLTAGDLRSKVKFPDAKSQI